MNFVFSRLFADIARDRIKPRKAATLAYVGQLLLGTLNQLRNEATWALGNERWRKIVFDSLVQPRDPEPPLTSADFSQSTAIEPQAAAPNS